MRKDVVWNAFFEDNRRFADVINAIGCAGAQVVAGEDLSEVTPKAGSLARDLIRKAAMGINFAIVGIENQDVADYELPVRIMNYDAVHYKKQVFDFIRYAEDKESLYRLVSEDDYYRNMDEDAYEVVSQYANLKDDVVDVADYKGTEGGIDMCKGIRDLMADSRAEGREEGREEGILLVIRNMLKKGMPVEVICELAECGTDIVEKVKKELQAVL